MKEQSQIEEMRAAVRGDRERARQRSLENVRTLVEPAPASAGQAPEPEPEPEPPPRRRLGLFGRRRR